jgi:hypothetical protein
MCPNAGSSDPQTNAWLAVFAPPITSRLNAAAPGANITDSDTFNLISQCAFDSVAHSRVSKFCALFSKSDFAGFGYSGDLNKYYGTGYVGLLCQRVMHHLQRTDTDKLLVACKAWATLTSSWLA